MSPPPLVFDPEIAHPRNVARAPVTAAEQEATSVLDLCAQAHIPLRVTQAYWRPVILHGGTDHYRTGSADYVGIAGMRGDSPRVRALRVLEILAHGFFDYAARECICGRGLFKAPRRLGRPPIGKRAMTAAERMRRMRARNATAAG